VSYKYSTGSVRKGDIYFEDDREGEPTYIDFGMDAITLRPSGSQILHAQSDAVGIGTTSPDYTLHVAGEIGVDQYIRHNGNPNTHINFADDKIILKAGNKAMVTMEEKGSAPHEVTINDGSNNIDFVVKGNGSAGGNPGMKFDASTNRLGVNGVGEPDEHLHVGGNMKLDGTEATIFFADGATDKATIGINSADNILIENKTMNKHIVFKANDQGTVREGLRLDGAVPEVVVNQQHGINGDDSLIDFRVESQNSTHMLFVDGASDKIGANTSTPGSGLHVNSSFATAIVFKQQDYTLTDIDHTVLVNCSGGNVTITLPTAVGCAGRLYVIKRVDSSGNSANIDANGSEQIEGSTSLVGVASGGSLTLQSDNSGWWKMAEYINPP